MAVRRGFDFSKILLDESVRNAILDHAGKDALEYASRLADMPVRGYGAAKDARWLGAAALRMRFLERLAARPSSRQRPRPSSRHARHPDRNRGNEQRRSAGLAH